MQEEHLDVPLALLCHLVPLEIEIDDDGPVYLTSEIGILLSLNTHRLLSRMFQNILSFSSKFVFSFKPQLTILDRVSSFARMMAG